MPKKTLIFLLIILAIAAFFRLWRLDSLPPGLWPDETAYVNDAIETLETGDFKVFYPENHGREGLFMWLLAGFFSLFGISVLSFKIVPALIGILTVLGIYLLAKELFRNEAISLLASFFLAISFWHVNFSRIGFRAILLPLVLTFAFYFFFRALRTKNSLDFILTGLIFGLGFYTYISFRLAVLVFGFVLLLWMFVAKRENWLKRYLGGTALLLMTTFIVALPIGLYFLENPEHFVSRALGVSVFETEQPVKEFLKSFGKHLAMFNFVGDRNLRHNLSGFPQLSPSAGIFFLVGIIFAVFRGFAGSFKERGIYLFLFVWLFALLLPGALTVEGVPHALRTIGVIPAAYIFAGLGAWLIYDWAKNKFRDIKVVAFGLLALMLVSSFVMYFVVWAKTPELKNAFPLNPDDQKVWRIVP
ncbi:MAG: hypothetical protein G01um101430_201 [Parcubacteria group bacterium Gr01-1014_30]|nr:MAG: hypothetical protein G01um101430_201 [Parcubacteria group bacterium Gr01-1014_30]